MTLGGREGGRKEGILCICVLPTHVCVNLDRVVLSDFGLSLAQKGELLDYLKKVSWLVDEAVLEFGVRVDGGWVGGGGT